MSLTPEQVAQLNLELEPLTDDEIRARLWGPDKRPHVLHHLENRVMARRDRFGALDRNIQKWILAVIVGALVATVLTWFLI
jgi:hypothetical protein